MNHRRRRLSAAAVCVALVVAAPLLGGGAATASSPSVAATESINGLGARLHRTLAEEQVDRNSNLVFSPASVGIALTMTSAGADGATLAEINEVLGITSPTIHDSMGGLAEVLTDGSDGSFTLANSLWVQDGFAIEEDFFSTLTGNYRSEPYRRDFAGEPAAAVDDINSWIADATTGRITDLLSEADINDLTRLLLANAVYLDADWAAPFSPDTTQPDEFRRGDGSTVEADFMHQTLHAQYGDSAGLPTIVLPYTNGYELVIVLPPEDGLASFEQELAESGDLDAAIGPLADREVVLSLPTWDLETRIELLEPLRSLGMALPFDRDGAEFTRISTEVPLAVSGVVHQANITVDEAGTEAAAATAVIIAAGAAPSESQPQPVEMDVDHSFFFAIRHTATGTVVFQGHLNDPSGEPGFG